MRLMTCQWRTIYFLNLLIFYQPPQFNQVLTLLSQIPDGAFSKKIREVVIRLRKLQARF